MNLLHFLLNCVGLGLWLCWRPTGLEPVSPWHGEAARAGSARRTGGAWLFLAVLAVLLVGRAWLYWQLGRDVDWVATLELGVVRLDFHSGRLGRMLFFSLAGFAVFLGGYFAWLLLLATVNRTGGSPHPWQRFVSAQLGGLARLPAPVGLLLPCLVLGGLWAAGHPWLEEAGLAAPVRSFAHLAQQAVVVGLGAVLVWEPLVVGLFVLHVLNSHLYLGNHALLGAVSLTARNLLRPLVPLPLRGDRFDFRPLVGLGLALAGFALTRAGLIRLFQRLPL